MLSDPFPSRLPPQRLTVLNRQPANPQGRYVLYWMISARRPVWNFALQRALEWAVDLDRPLLVLEALRCGYPWASDRLHQFVIQGMAANAEVFQRQKIGYYPYIESTAGAGKGLLECLAKKACVVVTDEFPCFFLPRMIRSASGRLEVRMEAVDGNGLLPLRAAGRTFTTAHSFRRFLQKELRPHLYALPDPEPRILLRPPLFQHLPQDVTTRWPPVPTKLLRRPQEFLAACPVDHRIGGVGCTGGYLAAENALKEFLQKKLRRYSEERNQPEEDVTSGLSPYLHFGHLSTHQVFHELTTQQAWTISRLSARTDGSRTGWWGIDTNAEAFLDQLVTWRELGLNLCFREADYDRYESLPAWARDTLETHARDRREHLYSLADFEQAKTHDLLWNAAQRQLAREGMMHNYLRMLWGKKILEWSRSPQEALAITIELNNKYALDGRDPNSYSGIFWILGRYDRPWGPERAVYGKIRFMSSQNTARKVRVKDYLRKYAE